MLYNEFILTTFLSCKKEKEIENSSIVGRWQLESVFNGYANGGNFQWNNVAVENSHILFFTKDELYNQKSVRGNGKECNGTYYLSDSDTLEINSDCNLHTLKMFVSELTDKSLILDFQGIEGIIRDRYVRIK